MSLEERRIGKMVMLDTKNPAAKPVELTLTNLPSNFKFTPMGLGKVCLQAQVLTHCWLTSYVGFTEL